MTVPNINLVIKTAVSTSHGKNATTSPSSIKNSQSLIKKSTSSVSDAVVSGNKTKKKKPAVLPTPIQDSKIKSSSKKPQTKKKSSTSSMPFLPSNQPATTTASPKTQSRVTSMELEATLCPICDEACTCPKTATSTLTVSSKVIQAAAIAKSSSITVATTSSTKKKAATAISPKKKIPSTSMSTSTKNKSKSKGTTAMKKMISEEESDFKYKDYSDSDLEDNEESSDASTIEDPALSFIRMIYSDEESLDEEEAYALYQATQLFSSSSEDEEFFYYQNANEGEVYYSEYDSDASDSDSDSEEYDDDDETVSEDNDNTFEYTVVEYVQPLKKQSVEDFIAYQSEAEDEGEEDTEKVIAASEKETSKPSNLLLNTVEFDEDSEEWQTAASWSIYDLHSNTDDCNNINININNNSNNNNNNHHQSLSQHGSASSETTLLFASSSADKIPNIAPQVLAAISAAAKYMSRSTPDSNPGPSLAKHFAYIATNFKASLANQISTNHTATASTAAAAALASKSNHVDMHQNEGSDSEEDRCDHDTDEMDNLSEISVELDEDEELIDSDGLSEAEAEDSEREEERSVPLVKAPVPVHASRINHLNNNNNNHDNDNGINLNAHTTTTTTNTNTTSETAVSYPSFNSWNRVPIGAFRRSRRPSIPPMIHPSMALKSGALDHSGVTLTGSLFNHATPNNSNNNGNDSFDEISGPERAYSVITLDELNFDIVGSGSGKSSSPIELSPAGSILQGAPKRARSLVPSLHHNSFEWLNGNWNWE